MYVYLKNHETMVRRYFLYLFLFIEIGLGQKLRTIDTYRYGRYRWRWDLFIPINTATGIFLIHGTPAVRLYRMSVVWLSLIIDNLLLLKETQYYHQYVSVPVQTAINSPSDILIRLFT